MAAVHRFEDMGEHCLAFQQRDRATTQGCVYS
jgi:hypothetical protein